jgi:hypothetical protein
VRTALTHLDPSLALQGSAHLPDFLATYRSYAARRTPTSFPVSALRPSRARRSAIAVAQTELAALAGAPHGEGALERSL